MLCCRKKVGLLGFPCRCGGTFCASHRLLEDHECPLRPRIVVEQRSALANANPIVCGDKVTRF